MWLPRKMQLAEDSARDEESITWGVAREKYVSHYDLF
jgi:hypothetical protein